MSGWSLPLGRWFGVDFRMHTFFLVLLLLAVFLASSNGASAWRGVLLWGILVGAVAARELARVLAASVCHIGVRSVLLLPIGGLLSPADPHSAEQFARAGTRGTLAAAGIGADLLVALILAALIRGATPQVALGAQPLISPLFLLRSAVWVFCFVGLVHLLPAPPLDAGRWLEATLARRGHPQGARQLASGLGRFCSLGAMLLGLALMALPAAGSLGASLGPWVVVLGFFLALGTQLERQGTLLQSVVDTVCMREVMLTDFITMSPSDTLQDALHLSVHTLQDDFPVVRGNEVVGVISRQSIIEALRGEGNGYVQAIMTRGFQVAGPEDSLGSIIRRMRRGRMSLVPIAEGRRVVGVVTLQNLMHSMGPLSDERKLRAHG